MGTPYHNLAEMHTFNLFALSGCWEQKCSFFACAHAPARAHANAMSHLRDRARTHAANICLINPRCLHQNLNCT